MFDEWEDDGSLGPMAELESKERLRITDVRDVISSDGSPDRFPDPRRALIGDACRFVAVDPPSRSAI
jgi:hypothetical protein